MKRCNPEKSLGCKTLMILGLLCFAQIGQITCVQLGRFTLTKRMHPIGAASDSGLIKGNLWQDRSITKNILSKDDTSKMPFEHVIHVSPVGKMEGAKKNVELARHEREQDMKVATRYKNGLEAKNYAGILDNEGDDLSSLRAKSADGLHSAPILPVVHSGSTMNIFRTALKNIDLDECEANGENAFYVCDLAAVYRLYLRWQKTMGGRVKPFFAVKSNPDPHILNLFAKLGLGFDCASHAEIAQVLALGVSPSNIIYANPCKAISFIREAHVNGVDMMTFDNMDELCKVAKYHPSAKMVIRILIDDRGSLCRFGGKFGAPLEDLHPLLKKASELGVNVIGVAFHVGSGCTNPELYKDAVKHAKWVFELATQHGFHFNLLDVGGGFGDDNLDSLAKGLLAGLNEHFPVGCGVTVIAEPGRYFVAEAFELATNVIARRQASSTEVRPDAPMIASMNSNKEPMTLYYINDGVYGAFNCVMFDHQVVYPKILTLNGKFHWEDAGGLLDSVAHLLPTPALLGNNMKSSGTSVSPVSFAMTPLESDNGGVSSSTDLELHPCKIFGPSCDSIDLVSETFLPTKMLKVGDWLRWTRMGAYTASAASEFNGFKMSQVKYTIDAKGDRELENKLKMIIGQ